MSDEPLGRSLDRISKHLGYEDFNMYNRDCIDNPREVLDRIYKMAGLE